MTDVLVTGGTGFLGSRLVDAYLGGGGHVRCAGHTAEDSLGVPPSPQEGLDYVEVDVCDRGDLVRAVAGMDVVVHTVAMTDASSPEERSRQEEVNVRGTRNVLEACYSQDSVSKLLYVSSTAAIGIPSNPEKPANEAFNFNLGGLGLSYHRTKRRAEKLVLDANGDDLSTLVVNPGFMFGPHRGEYRGSKVIDRVLDRRIVLCTGGGMSIVHVDDVVDGTLNAVQRGRYGQRYILSGENLTFREIAEVVCRVSDEQRVVLSVPNPVRDLLGYIKDSIPGLSGNTFHPHLHGRYAYPFYVSEKAKRELDYEPRGFPDIVAEYLDFCL